MRKLYFLILLFVPIISFAQSNYKSGYVINLKGDTLHGFIDYKEWGRSPKSIDFKPLLTDKGKDYSITDIVYFEISGYVSYHAYAVSISLNAVDISTLSASVDTSTTKGDIFLKVLAKGKYVTLYEYKDLFKEHFYIKENNMVAPVELLYGIYQDPNNSTNVISKNGYQGQLNELVSKYQPGNDKLMGQVQQSGYKDYELTPIVTQINGNSSEAISKSSKHNPNLRFFAGASLFSSTLKFSNVEGISKYYGVTPSTSASPKISIGIDAITNADVGHLVFRLELGYTQSKFSVAQQPNPIYNEASPILSSEKYKMNEVFITPQVIYNIYNKAMLKVFIDAGYSINILSYPNATIVTTRDGQVLYTQTTQGLESSVGNGSSIMLKGGVVISKRFELYAAYYVGVAVTSSTAYETKLTSYQAGLNYFIGKVAH